MVWRRFTSKDAWLVLGLVAAALLTSWLLMRHRVSEASLAHSLASEAGPNAMPDRCRPVRSTRWRCFVKDSSGPNGYAVSVDGHCWHADRLSGVAGGGGSREQFPSTAQGCIEILD